MPFLHPLQFHRSTLKALVQPSRNGRFKNNKKEVIDFNEELLETTIKFISEKLFEELRELGRVLTTFGKTWLSASKIQEIDELAFIDVECEVWNQLEEMVRDTFCYWRP